MDSRSASSPPWPLLGLLLVAALLAALSIGMRQGAEESAAVQYSGSGDVVLTDAQVEALLYALLTPGGEWGWEATAAAIRESGDLRFVAPMTDMLRHSDRLDHVGALLDELTGASRGTDWAAHVEANGAAPPPLPPGYAGWKGVLLRLATDDPGFQRFLYPDVPRRVRLDEVVWGGVGVDGIPALDDPATIPAAQATWLEEDEYVAGLALGGQHRAYPLRIIDWHEMVNDVVGGVPVALAYCTLCGAAVAYDTRNDPGPRRFGSSGLLMRSNKLMFDRATDSLWNQLTGEPVIGPLAGSDEVLQRLPVVISTWAEWRERHPDTDVLSLQTGHDRDYRPGMPYGEYFGSAETMFPVWQRKRVLPDKERVFTVVLDGRAKAWPLSALAGLRVVPDTVGGRPVVLVVGPTGPATVEPAGVSVRAFDAGGRTFSELDGAPSDGDGRRWEVTEEALISPDGARAERLPGSLAFWFGWFAFFPETEIGPPGWDQGTTTRSK